jgi:hypothetical protein
VGCSAVGGWIIAVHSVVRARVIAFDLDLELDLDPGRPASEVEPAGVHLDLS